jgi:hypothetical protein
MALHLRPVLGGELAVQEGGEALGGMALRSALPPGAWRPPPDSEATRSRSRARDSRLMTVPIEISSASAISL